MAPAPELDKVRVYGARAAILMEEVLTRSGMATVNLEGAPMGPGRRADWDAKVVVQVSPRELPGVVAVLHGWQHAVEATHQGPARNRGYRLRHEPDGHLTVGVFDPRGLHVARVELAERLAMAMLSLQRLALAYPGVSLGQLHTTLRGMCTSNALCGAPQGPDRDA